MAENKNTNVQNTNTNTENLNNDVQDDNKNTNTKNDLTENKTIAKDSKTTEKKEKTYIVTTKVKNFNGIVAGVHFAYGKARVKEGWILNWFREKGYGIEEEK